EGRQIPRAASAVVNAATGEHQHGHQQDRDPPRARDHAQRNSARIVLTRRFSEASGESASSSWTLRTCARASSLRRSCLASLASSYSTAARRPFSPRSASDFASCSSATRAFLLAPTRWL